MAAEAIKLNIGEIEQNPCPETGGGFIDSKKERNTYMIRSLLIHPLFLLALFIVNVAGTLYGYWWYGYQLAETPVQFLLFVPDSPTASLFFCIFLFCFMMGKHLPYIESLGMVTLFKYGIWAVVMNLLTLIVEGDLPWQGYMLIVSHGAMAVQGLLYVPYYRIQLRHLMVAAVWILHNDIVDYVYGMMPWYGSLSDYMEHIGYFTFWLSIVALVVAYWITVRQKAMIQYRQED